MKENSSYNEVVLQGNNLFAGTGHNSEIITDDEGERLVLLSCLAEGENR